MRIQYKIIDEKDGTSNPISLAVLYRGKWIGVGNVFGDTSVSTYYSSKELALDAIQEIQTYFEAEELSGAIIDQI